MATDLGKLDKDKSGVALALERIQNNLGRLEKAEAELLSKLQPALRPSEPRPRNATAIGGTDKSCPMSPLALELNRFATRIQERTEAVHELTERLDWDGTYVASLSQPAVAG